MNLLDILASGPHAYRGGGLNHENEHFAGELNLQVLESGHAILLHYVARLPGGKTVHSESTLLGLGQDGRPCLWPVMSELGVVLAHPALSIDTGAPGELTAIFGNASHAQQPDFREEITLELQADGGLLYAHAWGLPGDPFRDRSSCRMKPLQPPGS